MNVEQSLAWYSTPAYGYEFMVRFIAFGTLSRDANDNLWIDRGNRPNTIDVGFWLLVVPPLMREKLADIARRAFEPYKETKANPTLLVNYIRAIQVLIMAEIKPPPKLALIKKKPS